jgi:hypothetical protein
MSFSWRRNQIRILLLIRRFKRWAAIGPGLAAIVMPGSGDISVANGVVAFDRATRAEDVNRGAAHCLVDYGLATFLLMLCGIIRVSPVQHHSSHCRSAI